MRRMALWTAVALAPLTAEAQPLPGIIAPGSGSIADAAGNVWDITSSGSIQENGAWVAGGGGTAALIIAGRTIYGLDASGKGWFTFGTAAQAWSPSAAPGAV